MQKITPNLWYDRQAEEAANFYVSVFKNSSIGKISRYGKEGQEVHGMPEGTVMTISFQLEGQEFLGLNGGPIFKFNPSVSFLVACSTKEEVDEIWNKLGQGGNVLMELGEYPFSKRYGWTTDKYGLSWQVMYSDTEIKQKITPVLMFVGEQAGKAEEAIDLYTSVFRNAKAGDIMRYEKGEEPDKEGTIKYGSFTIEGQEFGAMDSAQKHDFAFNEAVSFIVDCGDQDEVDYYWNKLLEGGEESVCGWLKDKFGLSWQVVPRILPELLEDKDKAKAGRVMNAMLQMKKIIIADLKAAAEGKAVPA